MLFVLNNLRMDNVTRNLNARWPQAQISTDVMQSNSQPTANVLQGMFL